MLEQAGNFLSHNFDGKQHTDIVIKNSYEKSAIQSALYMYENLVLHTSETLDTLSLLHTTHHLNLFRNLFNHTAILVGECPL